MAASAATRVSKQKEMSGLLLGRYEIGKLLGHGTFAKVYHARNLKTGDCVAIKVIDKEKILKVGLIAHIKREISILRRVRHPNIVQLFEVMATKSKIFFVMEYVKGGELFNKVAKGRLKEEVARKYFQQLISAVAFCHARGVYHRDLKPENILLDEDGDLKVSDFGLSAISEQIKQDGLFHTFCGTPAYVAPEVLARKGYNAAKVDIWSCGVILFVLMAGYLPFHDQNVMSMYKKIYKGEFRCPRWFSPELIRFLTRLLDTNPETRITIPEIMNNKWFKKGFKNVKFYIDDDKLCTVNDDTNNDIECLSDQSMSESDSEFETRRKITTLPRPASLNAFDIISFSRGFDLSGLFEEGSDGGARFVSGAPMSSKPTPWRRRRFPAQRLLLLIALFATLGIVMLGIKSVDPSSPNPDNQNTPGVSEKEDQSLNTTINIVKNCATVEEMGEIFGRGYVEESLRLRRIIRDHFALNGASTVRELPQHQFCKHGFVIGKASEAGLGNEMYKILTAAAVSVMLNRSLIIGQTRGKYPFGDYVSYSNQTFTMKEVKHLWRKNRCLTKYGRHLTMRIDDFQKPALTNVLCSNWRIWQEPIIWFQNATDAVAAQFFLKSVHSEMREAASHLFGRPEDLQNRANVFGELMRVLISPSKNVEWAVNWALSGSQDPDIVLHMRMMMNRSVRARQAALDCVKKIALDISITRPKLVLVSDTPSLVKDILPNLEEFSEVLHFDYKSFGFNISGNNNKLNGSNFRVKDWGPAPRWVAFVDFFLASRAKHSVISGAHRRVGTTYIQLIAALAAAYRLDENNSSHSGIRFFSSFQSNLVSEGLKNQVGWGHVWNRFAGPLSCRSHSNQCALTPILAPAWWDGLWQSPIPRDIRRMEAYGIKLSGFGTSSDDHLNHFCHTRKDPVFSVPFI